MATSEQAPFDLFYMLGDELRLRILCLLQVEELCKCDLKEILKVPDTRLVRQLVLLRQAGLIRNRKSAGFVYFSMQPTNDPIWQMVAVTLPAIRDRWKKSLDDAVAAKAKTRPACPPSRFELKTKGKVADRLRRG
jgi:ArsR family transcriptional regulator, arsenate/arsenite/antimonite-responsive transcriptional repressor